MRIVFPIGLLLLLILSGCDEKALVQKLTPPEFETAATNYINLLRAGKFEKLQADMDPSLQSENPHKALVEMSLMIPPQEPKSVNVIGAYQYYNSGIRQVNLIFEYQFPTRWILISVALQKQNAATTIIGFHVSPQSDSQENLNRFTLSGKSFAQYAILACAVIVPIFVLSIFVLCVRTKMAKRKWLWLIFILLGIGVISVNWTTGDCRVSLLSLLLLGASAFAPQYGAWQISTAFPVGAILFLWRRKKLMAAAMMPPPIPIEQPTDSPAAGAP